MIEKITIELDGILPRYYHNNNNNVKLLSFFVILKKQEKIATMEVFFSWLLTKNRE